MGKRMYQFGISSVFGGFAGLAGGCGAIAYYSTPKLKPPMKPENETKEIQTFIITGANRGIGKSLALELAQRKHQVIMACRSLKKCEIAREEIVEKSGNKSVTCELCDLNSLKSIREFVQRLKEKFPDKIKGGLVNNARQGKLGYSSTTEDGFEKHFGVNFLGPFYLSRLCEQSILKRESRIIYLMNLQYRFGVVNFDELNPLNQKSVTRRFKENTVLSSSLAAVMMMIEEESERLKGHFTINSVYPDYIFTEEPVNFWQRKLFHPIMECFTNGPEVGCSVPLQFCLDKNLNEVTGKLYGFEGEISKSKIVENKENNYKLLTISEYWTGLKSKDDILTKK